MMYEGRLYKVLDNMASCHGGTHTWVPGEWVRVEGELNPCKRGIHLCRDQDLIYWLGPQIWAAEYRGDDFIIHKDKVVVREARITTKYESWNETTARLLACDFVKLTAARAAAWDAARAAARAAAWAAARAAAWAAARAAAWDAMRQWQTKQLMKLLHSGI
jgi:hypothetical protein